MTMRYENFQNLEREEKNQETRNGDKKGGMESPKFALTVPSQSFLWRILSWTHLLLFSLGLSLLLLVVISVIGSQNSQLRRDLGTLRASLDNITSKIKAEFQSLDSRADNFEKGISSLKVDVEDHRKELQAGRDLSQKVTSLESTVEKREQALKTDLSDLTDHVQQLEKDLKTLTCQLANLKNNNSEVACCPLHWTEHEGSCYWFSESEKSWPEADKYCRLENSHLVVVNSLKEQNFLQNRLARVLSWMGLTDQNGPWRWVDGTDFDTGFKYVCHLQLAPLYLGLSYLFSIFSDPRDLGGPSGNMADGQIWSAKFFIFRNWRPLQPDNWHGHMLGGGEDCAHFSYDGRWNDDVCQRHYHWICETELGKAS
ncbi:C-type lectin domain family 10 member A-like isoform X1 [Mus caroli]|uniref:C-type lectin domain family 10 member A-like isoform X1 n=1 Tax=Mus caroli TaxID=10089 RepID=A0A6P7RW85_MUSCR|nr:C-type lectin domain family 10 member A-like isoform X1 [Mus caroli]